MVSHKIYVFVSKNHRIDYINALHIKDVSGVNVYAFERDGHEIVKLLRDEGKCAIRLA